LELGVDRIDLSIRAVLGQQRLREEAREAIQGLLQSLHLHLEPWNQLESVGGWNQLKPVTKQQNPKPTVGSIFGWFEN
jgi:hypothetical protein